MLSILGRIGHKEEEHAFKNKLSDLLASIENTNEKKYKVDKYFEILDMLDRYHYIFFYNETKWEKFIDTVEKKLNYFIKNEKDISEKTTVFIEKHFRCKAICKHKKKCKHKINRKKSRCFCSVHKKYILKFKNILKEITDFDDNIIDKITFYSF